MRHHHGIAALVVDQRSTAGIFKCNDLADQNPVVTTVNGFVGFTLKTGRCVRQQRRTAKTGRKIDSGKLVFTRTRKVVGDINLVSRQNVDGKVSRFFEDLTAAGALVDAPQNQGRIEGYGVEAVGRYTGLHTLGRLGGNNGNAGGEVAQSAAKGFGIEFSDLIAHKSTWCRVNNCFNSRPAAQDTLEVERTGSLRGNGTHTRRCASQRAAGYQSSEGSGSRPRISRPII